jgi:drug/metabolite transporter (DMT)-like permease
MDWITASLIVAATMALVNVIDSHMISKRVPSLWAYLLPVGVLQLTYGVIVLVLNPLPQGVEAFPWVTVAISTVTRTAAITLMLYAMRTEEVSRIIPVTNTYPVFVALMAVPLLGESVVALQWLAIFMTVAGAVLISIKGGSGGKGARLRRSFVLLLLSSVLFGVANTATKYALGYISFWNMYALNALCFGAAFFLMSARVSVFRELREMQGRGAVLTLLGINETIALGAAVLSFWAMQRGPIALVSTIMAVRPFFVFLYAVALSRAFPAVLDERLTRGIAVLKIVSIALIIGGVAIINIVADT